MLKKSEVSLQGRFRGAFLEIFVEIKKNIVGSMCYVSYFEFACSRLTGKSLC